MKDITNVEYFKNTLIFLKLEVKAGEQVLEKSLENCKRTKMYEGKVKAKMTKVLRVLLFCYDLSQCRDHLSFHCTINR